MDGKEKEVFAVDIKEAPKAIPVIEDGKRITASEVESVENMIIAEKHTVAVLKTQVELSEKIVAVLEAVRSGCDAETEPYRTYYMEFVDMFCARLRMDPKTVRSFQTPEAFYIGIGRETRDYVDRDIILFLNKHVKWLQ